MDPGWGGENFLREGQAPLAPSSAGAAPPHGPYPNDGQSLGAFGASTQHWTHEFHVGPPICKNCNSISGMNFTKVTFMVIVRLADLMVACRGHREINSETRNKFTNFLCRVSGLLPVLAYDGCWDCSGIR